jgi:hypothetical protein
METEVQNISFTSTGLSLIVQSMFDLKAAIKVNDYLKY